MVLRKLTLALLGMGVMLPGLSHALSVRDIQTKSALGQPLRIEVELSDVGDLSSEDIKVGLATQEDFQRLGIERIFFLTDLRFDVVINQASRSFIKITSAKRVTEPFLDFVIRISWPNNTRLQEVPVLLDPPVTVSSRQPAVEAPVVVAAPVPAEAALPEARPQPVVPAQPETVAVAVPEQQEYRVKRRDNLWSIAQRVRPDNSVSVPHMMQALFKANPQAFVANNINMLRDGQVLRVPTLGEVRSASERMAAASAGARAAGASTKPLARQQINATPSANRKLQAVAVPRAEMRLVAPAGGVTAEAGKAARQTPNEHRDDSRAGHGLVAGSGKGAASRPSATALAREVAALESKLKTNDKTIAMQNATLARLEAQLKARAAQEQQAKQKQAAEKDRGHERKALAALACGVATQSFLSTEAKAAEAPANAGGSSMMPLVAGVVVLLLVIGAIVALKGKSKAAPQRPASPPPAPKPAAAAPAPKPAPAPAPEPKKPVDPAEEARAYLNLERFPQAVGVLSKALAQTPDRTDLHLMLLEIYAKQNDRQSFEEQYARLESVGELEPLMKADELKALLSKPEAPKPPREETIEFVPSAPRKEEVAEAGPSLEDLEKDFALSLSQPNLKALDIEIKETPSVAEEAKLDEIDSLLGKDLEFSYTAPAAEPEVKAEPAPSMDFNFEAVVEEAPAKPVSAMEELSLDSLDAFLEENKATPEPKVEAFQPAVEEAAFDFDKALADFKDESVQPAAFETPAAPEPAPAAPAPVVEEAAPVAEAEVNLAEGLELEEFNVSQINLPVADVPLRSETQTGLEALDGDFNFEEFASTPAPAPEPAPALAPLEGGSLDLGSAAAAFDAELGGGTAEEEFAQAATGDEDPLAALDREFAFLATTDENSTRLELARAYVEMGDKAAARDLLEEVIAEGKEDQKTEAQGMLMRIA